MGLSGRGREVAFASNASNLVANDTNGASDVFVRDLARGINERISDRADGTEANGRSIFASLSTDGRYVAFVSEASNLVPDDTNGVADVFVADRNTSTIVRVSRSSAGVEANGPSSFAQISGDGNWVAYTSSATNLVAADSNGVDDIFVSNRSTGATYRTSVSSTGLEANGASSRVSLDDSGQVVVYASLANNLVPGDTNAAWDVFVHVRSSGTTTRVSIASDGSEANSSSVFPRVSGDGSVVLFLSNASNLTPGDTNSRFDLFAHDRASRGTDLVSRSAAGGVANGHSSDATSSRDGRYVAFSSTASDIVAGDTNGATDIFLLDRATGGLTRIAGPAQPDGSSIYPVVASDGSFVAFASDATNLVAADTNGSRDIFVASRP